MTGRKINPLARHANAKVLRVFFLSIIADRKVATMIQSQEAIRQCLAELFAKAKLSVSNNDMDRMVTVVQ